MQLKYVQQLFVAILWPCLCNISLTASLINGSDKEKIWLKWSTISCVAVFDTWRTACIFRNKEAALSLSWFLSVKVSHCSSSSVSVLWLGHASFKSLVTSVASGLGILTMLTDNVVTKSLMQDSLGVLYFYGNWMKSTHLRYSYNLCMGIPLFHGFLRVFLCEIGAQIQKRVAEMCIKGTWISQVPGSALHCCYVESGIVTNECSVH